jgi:fatty-acyl-CoA synthase
MFDRLVPEAAADAALARLQSAGVGRGVIVAWLGPNHRDLLATLVACERLGAVLMPLNHRLAVPELQRLLQHAGASQLVAWPHFEALAATLRGGLPPVPMPAEGVTQGDVLLVYTSGTTGDPKGAMHTRQGLIANAQAAVAVQGLRRDDRVLAVLPLFHVGGLAIQVLPALSLGAQLLLQPRFEPAAWFDAVEQQRPTTTLLVPAVMRSLIEHPRWAAADLSSLRFVNSGSQIVPRPLIEAFHARGVPVAQVYGATETGPVSIALHPDDALRHVGLAGRPAPGVQLRLAADGEIQLKAPNLMRGYHRRADRGLDAEGWFASGDLARLHDGGLVEVVGRSAERLISGGENVHPAEIEALVAQSPEVADCAVVGLPSRHWGEVPVLALVLQPGRMFDEAALQRRFDAELARFKHPRHRLVLPALPRTALGKVQRPQLEAQLLRLLGDGPLP